MKRPSCGQAQAFSVPNVSSTKWLWKLKDLLLFHVFIRWQTLSYQAYTKLPIILRWSGRCLCHDCECLEESKTMYSEDRFIPVMEQGPKAANLYLPYLWAAVSPGSDWGSPKCTQTTQIQRQETGIPFGWPCDSLERSCFQESYGRWFSYGTLLKAWLLWFYLSKSSSLLCLVTFKWISPTVSYHEHNARCVGYKQYRETLILLIHWFAESLSPNLTR